MSFKTGFGLIQNVKDSAQKIRAGAFWDKYFTDLRDSNWLKSLYNKLMGIDLTNFDPKKPPMTEEKALMREKNIDPLYIYMRGIIVKEQ